MAHDTHPAPMASQDLENLQDWVEVLTLRSESMSNAYQQANAKVGTLMRAQLTRDQLLAECIAPLKWLHHLSVGGQPDAAPPLSAAQCEELLARLEALKESIKAGEA